MLNNTINYDELDAEFGITPTIENKSVNNIALSNVHTLEPEYEQDYIDAYSIPSWFDDLNVCSEDEIKQWQAMGPMGIAEAWKRNNKWQAFAPYINTTKDAAEAVNASVLLKRLKDGKELNEKQMDLLVDYLRDVKEQQVRGYSFAGGVVNGTLESIPYLEEFAIGLATSEAGVGLASLAKTITTMGAKKAAKKAVQKAMQEAAVQSTMTGVKKNLTKQQIKSIYDDAILKTTTSKAIAEVGAKTFAKETLKATPQALLSSAKIGLTKMPQNFVGNIADRQLAGGIYVTDAGQGVFNNSENIALSFMKALGDTTFEALSETAGFMFVPINKFFAKPIRNVLPKKFYTEFDKLVSSRYGMKTTEALKKYGYDGILEEMGEEQLNRFLTNVFGSNGVQGYTLDGFLNNVFYFDREGKEGLEGFKTGALNAAESYASEALSFAAISGGARSAIGGTSKLAEKWNEKRLQNEYKKLANYSLNEFYLDQGLIKIKGSQSSTEAALRHRANAMGIDSATIDEYCKLSSENEMRAKLQELILDDNAKIDVEALRNEQEAVEKLRENYFNQLKAAGADDVVANQTASLYALGFAKLTKDSGKSINEIAETNISFKNLTEDEAVKQYNQGFNQVPQDVEPKFQAAASAGANENEIAEAEKEYAEKGTESKYFKKWSNNTPLVKTNEEAMSYEFKTGKGVTVKGHHGTKRKDRIGSVFLPERSTSGPMAFFSSNREVSEGYAKNKEDTSLSNEINSYSDWFKIKINDEEYSLDKAWNKLPLSKRNEITQKAGSITLNWDTEEIIFDENEKRGLGQFDYNIRYKRGNALEALIEEWLNSGHLYGSEEEILKVLDFLDLDVVFNDPNKVDAGVYDVYITMQKPFVTNDIPVEVLETLENEAKKQPMPRGGFGADPWDKNTKDPIWWINTLKEDYANGENSHVWTSIPDWVTNVLKQYGYDGIIDIGGKSGGEIHKVYIPFTSEQIKSVDNRGTFDAENPNIYYQAMIKDIDKNQKVDIIDLSTEFIKNQNLTKKDLSSYIKTLIGTAPLKSSDKKALFEFVKKSKRVGKKDVYVPDHIAGSSKVETKYKKERITFVKNITNLIQKSVFIDIDKNDDKNTKPNIDNYLRFYVPVRINNDIFTVRITAENNESKNLFNILNADVYDVIIDKKIQASSPSTMGNLMKPVSNNIITQSQQTSSVEKITIEEMLKGVKDPDGKLYFQSAWHGGAVNFDKFDLGYALSGEGAMAHGWGVYLAQNRDVSEGYRKKLIANTSFTYEGKTYFVEETFGNALYKIKNYGKDKAIEFFQDKEQEFRDQAKTSRNPDWWNKEADEFKKLVEQIKNVDESKIEENKGQLYEVDIPEDDVLLDEDWSFSDQSKNVKDALEKIANSLIGETTKEELENEFVKIQNDIRKAARQKFDGYFVDVNEEDLRKQLYKIDSKLVLLKSVEENNTYYKGKDIYNALSNLLGSAEKASKLLNEYGIKGITYDGYQDGRCYVIFDDKAVDIIKKYYQGLDEDSNEANTEESIRNAKGFFYEKKAFDGTPKENIVVLIKNKADASTLVHEFAHIYLQTLNNLARTSDKAKQQLLTVNKWLRYDGKEYTTAQHEKFADGFVAYVKSGKAPSYGLKRVFENFRRWLSDIYNNIVTSENVELDNETKKVFDELLGDLSVNQQEKLSEEIITKARENAALRMRDELVEKGKVKFNELTEKQRRYRDTAYDIIFYALKHSKDEETRNYVQNISDLRMKLGSGNTKSLQRQFERIELLLAETDDAFSAHDGFLPEWGEFFNDTGVSYDNLQQGADAELALNAFEVIRDKKYLYDESFEELSENDVKKAQYELDYIINEYKYAEDKSIPMSAFFTWIDSQHPYIQDELLKQWENETNEIDRYQAMSKFEQAKEDLKVKAMQMQGLGDYSMQFAEYARAIVKRLDFMTEKDKARIFDKLKDFNSFKEVLANLDDVMDFAQTLYNVTERRKIADDIIKEVKGTIHEWKDGIKRTKYTYPANNLFTRLRELNKLPLEDIKDLYDAQVNEEIKPTYEADAVNTDDYYETIEKMFIEFKANGVYYNSTEFLQDLLTRIQNAKFTAKIARDEMDFERRMQAINLVDEAAKAVDKHKGKVSKLEQAYRYGFNLNSALEMMFDKNIKSKFTLDYLYAQKDAKVGADRDAVLEKLKKNFGFKGPIADTLLFNKFIDMTKKEFKITQRYSPDIAQGVIRETHRDKETGKVFTDKKINYAKDAARLEWEPEEIELSRMEVLYYYIQSLNEESYKILTDMGSETQAPKGQFDKYEFDEMINQLTDQERMMGLILQQAAEKYYDELNRYHIKKYHTELGKVNMYFPRKTELTEVKPLELFSDYANYSGVLSAQKQRTANAGARIAPANALAVLFQHMEKANTLIVMGEQLDLMNRVFKDQSLKKKVEIVWGIDTAKEFYNQIAGNLYSGQTSMLSEAENLIGRIENNVIKAQIFAKAQVGLKQIISFLNYGTGDEHVSTAEWNAAFWKQSFTPKEWKNNIDYMMNIPYLKDRFGRGGSTDALKRQLEQRMFAKMSLLDEFFSLPIKIGDMGAIILGGKPYIDALINKGYTEEQAQKLFIEKTVNEMQSSIPSTLSNLQRNAAKQPLAKMFFAYQNTPWQYFRVAANSMIQFKQNPNKDTTLNMVKLVGLYMYIFPLIFNLASSLSIITGDEDELKNDIWKSIMGGVTFIPLAGQFINAMLSGVLGERVSTGNWFDTAAAKTGNIARKMAKGDDVTAVDILKALALFGEAGTGLPLTTLGTEVAGVGDIATGSPAKGIMKVAGYSDYRAKKITGEEN